MGTLEALTKYFWYTYSPYIDNYILQISLSLIGLCWLLIFYLALAHPITLYCKEKET